MTQRALRPERGSDSARRDAGDASKSNLVAASLFADGAAAVLIGAGDEGPEVLGSHSTNWANTEDVMGCDLIETGVKVRFAKSAA